MDNALRLGPRRGRLQPARRRPRLHLSATRERELVYDAALMPATSTDICFMSARELSALILVATKPRQVYSWDITKLAGPVKGTYFDAYVMIDIFSRYVVGVHVHTHESGVLAKELMEQIFAVHGVPQVVHADRGTSMTSKTVAALLADLDVTRSHSRPRVSNDNPYSESLFKTLKYGPEFPERFGSLNQARHFMDTFTHWYNHEHRHTGIGLHTPADVHFGLAAGKAADRRDVLTAARAQHPHRFTTSTPPKILDLPDTVWINQPAEDATTDRTEPVAA